MSTPPELHEITFRIYPTDCDMLGHVNHARMLVLLERARWALLERQIKPRQMLLAPVFPVIRQVNIGYHAQAFPGDVLLIQSGIVKVGNTSYTIRQHARKHDTHELVADADIVVVALNREGTPVKVPREWLDAMPGWTPDTNPVRSD
ncbi:MAG TPA: thioesterase family protein [Gemmatimonadaceae bacterium]|jgi:YbgC/YbaW family acyl-CoA thioester hydrolase|nr:thioesterase family protein [Gemmatimonadaceae bacterium]